MRATKQVAVWFAAAPGWLMRSLVLVLPLVAGCVAPVFLPVLMASGAAGGMGANLIGDALNGSIEANPDLRLEPDFAHDPELEQALVAVRALHAGFSPAHLEPTPTADGCALGEPARWLIAHRMPEASVNRHAAVQRDAMGPAARLHVDRPEVVVVEGSCAGGAPVGAFVAVATVRTRSSITPELVTTSVQRQWISGTFADGLPDGAWHIVAHDNHETGPHVHTMSIARIEHFAAGAPVGRHVAQGRNGDATTTTITEHHGDGSATVRHYAGRLPLSTTQLSDGVQHGWLEVHGIEYVVGHRTEASSTCYQNGREAPASLCGPRGV